MTDLLAPANEAPTQLTSANPADWPVAPGWQPLVDEFFGGPVGQKLLAFLQSRMDAGASIFPPRPLRALELTLPEAVRLGVAAGAAMLLTPGTAPCTREDTERLFSQTTPPVALDVPEGV